MENDLLCSTLVSTKTFYFCDYVANKPELDSLFSEFEELGSSNKGFVQVLKVQNLQADKLFPCFVVYSKCLLDL